MVKTRLRRALGAAGWHLLASALVAAVAAGLVFGIWYPYPYRELVGGRELFLIVVAVDVVCGPLLTWLCSTTSNPAANWRWTYHWSQ